MADAGRVEAPPGGVGRSLAAQTEPGGFVRFDRFMETALYAPGAGYYERSGRSPFGPRGDYYTAAHVGPLFAGLLARRIGQAFREQGSPRRFRIVEVGPGDGALADAVIRALEPALPPDSVWQYVLVERSAALRDRLVQRFARDPPPRPLEVRWSDALGADGPFSGVILGNELLDAMPARRLVWRAGGWQEQGVVASGSGWTWAERPIVERIPDPPLPLGTREGAILEVGTLAEGFLREVADHLERGVAILVDYGAGEPELIGGHPAGTIQAIQRHTAVGDPLEHPGDADLSAFVNFTRLRGAATAVGLRERAFRPMREALGDWGLESVLADLVAAAPDEPARVRQRLAAKSLTFGFENFWVLELEAGSGDRPGSAGDGSRRQGPGAARSVS